jgi:hypothetical protein
MALTKSNNKMKIKFLNRFMGSFFYEIMCLQPSERIITIIQCDQLLSRITNDFLTSILIALSELIIVKKFVFEHAKFKWLLKLLYIHWSPWLAVLLPDYFCCRLFREAARGAIAPPDSSPVDNNIVPLFTIICYYNWSKIFVRCLIILGRELMNVFMQ